MSWKAKFRLLHGWQVDKPAFALKRDAVGYALAMATRHTVIVDFDVVKRKRAPNSSFVRRG